MRDFRGNLSYQSLDRADPRERNFTLGVRGHAHGADDLPPNGHASHLHKD
jgi:hypothetical protein